MAAASQGERANHGHVLPAAVLCLAMQCQSRQHDKVKPPTIQYPALKHLQHIPSVHSTGRQANMQATRQSQAVNRAFLTCKGPMAGDPANAGMPWNAMECRNAGCHGTN